MRSTRRKLSAVMQIATVAELSASIAHEINQPLASVVTNCARGANVAVAQSAESRAGAGDPRANRPGRHSAPSR